MYGQVPAFRKTFVSLSYSCTRSYKAEGVAFNNLRITTCTELQNGKLRFLTRGTVTN